MLELDRISRRYGNNTALDELSFDVSAGEVVGFLGPNGAGKTTAMRAVLGIVRPDSGELRWRGQKIDLSSRLQFGYMPEERGLYSTMVIIEQLIFLGRLHGLTREQSRQAAYHWLDVLGISDRAEHRLDGLSLGNQQRVQLAAALLHSPSLLVLDEPFSGLDPTGIEALSGVLTDQARNGTAVVFSSHQLDLVEDLCQRVVIINKGRTIVTGRVQELTEVTEVLVVRVEGGETGWADELEGVSILEPSPTGVRLRLHEHMTSDMVLDRARQAGMVTHLSFERRRLSEVFRRAVAS